MTNLTRIVIGVAVGLILFVLAMFFFVGRASGWTHNIITDPMSDDITAEAIAIAADGRGRLAVSCKNNGPIEIVFQTTTRMGGYRDDENYVDRMLHYRFDDGPIADTVAVFGDNYIGFRENKKWEEPIIKALSKARKLAIEAESETGEDVQLVFNVSGSERAMKRVNRECNK